MEAARAALGVQAIVLDTEPVITTDAGGHWWDVAVPEVSIRPAVNVARENYEKALQSQQVGD
jgi:3D-(3,5/4)-trihydroxycyclohexane-1,2-dione acylhydrolase (decyclizing)